MLSSSSDARSSAIWFWSATVVSWTSKVMTCLGLTTRSSPCDSNSPTLKTSTGCVFTDKLGISGYEHPFATLSIRNRQLNSASKFSWNVATNISHGVFRPYRLLRPRTS